MKAGLRARLHALRDSMTQEDRRCASEAITRDLLELERYKTARTVLAYMSFGSEFLTDGFIRSTLDNSKILVLARVERTRNCLELHVVRGTENELTAGPWGIREPRPELCPSIDVSEIDFVLVPGLGFTPLGDRLGYGHGYYDRLLAHRKPHTALVAAAFSIQVVEEIPVTVQDVPIDMIITEAESYCPKHHGIH